MPWQSVQIGLIVICLALIFAGGVGIATGRWWMLFVAAAAIVVLVAVQVYIGRHRREWTEKHEP